MINFTHEFIKDFDILMNAIRSPEPLAFARFGDGEYAIMRGMKHVAKSDRWTWENGSRHELTSRLCDSLLASQESSNYYVGISSKNHHPHAHDWYIEQLKKHDIPLELATFASIFMFGNYDRFLGVDLTRYHLVASTSAAEIIVPPNPSDPQWSDCVDFTVDALIENATLPIFVAAGPWSPVIIHEYWKRAARRRTIVDIGSVLDVQMKSRKTRRYHHKDNPQRNWIPIWSAQDAQ